MPISRSCSVEATVHVLVIPFLPQGHLLTMMKLVHHLANHGIKISVLATESAYSRLKTEDHARNGVTVVSVPDDLETEDERRDEQKAIESFFRTMPAHTVNFVNKVNQSQNELKITCMISDLMNIWSLEIARKLGIKIAVYEPVVPGCFATWLKLSELVEAGIIDEHGSPIKNEEVILSPHLPALRSADYPWVFPGNPLVQSMVFQLVRTYDQYHKGCDWILGNWFHDLDPSVYDLRSNILPVGPLLATDKPENLSSDDMSCLSWLDKQPPGSVIYAAFGTTVKRSRQQFEELALGLELTGKPFLWAVGNGVSACYPGGFEERVRSRGKVVEWAPQEQVLAHPSIACFLTHCGWNSVLEGMSYGIPMLCWPFVGDHFYNRTCIRDGWKIGLEVKPDEKGIVTRDQIKVKVDELVSDTDIKANALNMKELARKSITKEGSSYRNLEDFVGQIEQLKV